MFPATHCTHCQGSDESIENPVHHPTYEITPKCNLNCIYCYSNVALKKGKAPLPGYYGDTEDVRSVTLSQYGEPLVAGVDEVERIAKELKDMFPQARLDLQTNGTLLNEKAIERLEKYFELAMVSLDVSSKEKYARITGFDGFDILMENLKALSRSSIMGVIRTIYMPGINDEDVFELAELARRLDMEVFLQPLSVYDRELMESHGLDMERTEDIVEFLDVTEKLREIADVRIPGCFIVNVRRIERDFGREYLKLIRRNALAEVPEMKRERKFVL
ncbi:radical SAM protein [Geoglobus acetivorans]|uniref:Radical SAM protein n=1 Tax=Geoglobus acetivorans TaxID=565033 RepID=A0ABZ3H5I3_GEOAI|nr:radical SAM protein [Geoglobus acetivorans]